MAIPSHKHNEPLLISVDEIQKDLHKLKKSRLTGDATHIWQTAGHIWDSAKHIGDMAKDSLIKSEVWKIRKALTDIILTAPHNHSDANGFSGALSTIADACASIHKRL